MSPISLNFDNAEPSGFEPLPEEWYHVKVVDAAEETASTGAEGVALKMEVQDGPHRGRYIWDRIWFTPKSMSWSKDKLECLGYRVPAGDFDLNPSDLIGKRAEVRTKHETYEGKLQVRVAAYQPWEDSFAAAATPSIPDWRSELPASEDDDIPFD